MHTRIRECRAEQQYKAKLMGKVFVFIKFEVLRKKREAVMAEIIKEKHDSLIAIKVLEVWKIRFQERVEKKVLYS